MGDCSLIFPTANVMIEAATPTGRRFLFVSNAAIRHNHVELQRGFVRPKGKASMVILAFFVSLLMVAGGVLFVSEATMGVFIAAAACWVGIWARVYQATIDGEKTRTLLREIARSDRADSRGGI